MLFLQSTIRAQMMRAIAGIVIAVMVLLLTVTLFVAQHQLYELGERDARDRVEAVAARAGFAAIVGADSPDVAKQLVAESTGVNGIFATALLSPDAKTLAEAEQRPGALHDCGFDSPAPHGAPHATSRKLKDFWCVSAPVFKRTTTDSCLEAPCIVGYVHMVASSASVDAIVHRLIEAILFMSLVLLTGALFVLSRVSAEITSPLRDIALVMRRYSSGDRTARALELGPEEAVTISHVYNELIEAQEEQARTLEHTVDERTQQLRQATLAAQDADRYKTTFMAHISHDMRTPLHVIQAQASEVMNELEFAGDPDRARDHVEVIIQQSRELSLRVAQILELTRGGSGGTAPELEAISIEVLRAHLLDKAEMLARQNRNKLIFIATPAIVWTDGDKALQIITNLIENACKFTLDGTVEVDLHAQNEDLWISVKDSGMGIPAHQIDHIWSEFRQVQYSDGRRMGGFGLGLAIVRQYANMLGGHFGAESQEGQGTRVWVVLPAKAPHQHEAVS